MPAFRLSHSQLKLVRADGEELAVPSYLTGFDSLLDSAQREAYLRYWPELWDRALDGREVEFERSNMHLTGFGRRFLKIEKIVEVIGVGPKGISFPQLNKNKKRAFVDWPSFKQLQVSVFLAIETKRWWSAKQSLGALGWVANPHLLIHLIQRVQRLRGEPEGHRIESQEDRIGSAAPGTAERGANPDPYG